MNTSPESLAGSKLWFAAGPPEVARRDREASLLVDRSRAGCHEAYRLLVESHRLRIYRFCLGWTGNPEDAEELCQDTFVRAFSALPRYQNEDRFAAWLFRIARNRCHDYHRSRSRREAERTRSLERGEHEPLVSPVPGPDEKISGREDLAKLRRAIAALPERLREVLVLCGLEEMSHEECAVLLGCSRRAVEGRLYRARLELADALERDRT